MPRNRCWFIHKPLNDAQKKGCSYWLIYGGETDNLETSEANCSFTMS